MGSQNEAFWDIFPEWAAAQGSLCPLETPPGMSFGGRRIRILCVFTVNPVRRRAWPRRNAHFRVCMRIYGVSGRFARFTPRRKIYCVFTALRAHGAESMHFSRVIWHAGFHAYIRRFGQRTLFRRAFLSSFRHFSLFFERFWHVSMRICVTSSNL